MHKATTLRFIDRDRRRASSWANHHMRASHKSAEWIMLPIFDSSITLPLVPQTHFVLYPPILIGERWKGRYQPIGTKLSHSSNRDVYEFIFRYVDRPYAVLLYATRIRSGI